MTRLLVHASLVQFDLKSHSKPFLEPVLVLNSESKVLTKEGNGSWIDSWLKHVVNMLSELEMLNKLCTHKLV